MYQWFKIDLTFDMNFGIIYKS